MEGTVYIFVYSRLRGPPTVADAKKNICSQCMD